MASISTTLGFPRIGLRRELKFALEKFWRGEHDEATLIDAANQIEANGWSVQKAAGIELIPVGDFSLYDHVLDTLEMIGGIPNRYHQIDWESPLERYFAMARGSTDHGGVAAMEMTKWFDTNYHYIVPEWETGQTFELHADHLIAKVDRAKRLGIRPKPVVIGPMSLIQLGKSKSPDVSADELFEAIVPVYEQLCQRLESHGVGHLQIDEPCLSQELDETALERVRQSTQRIVSAAPRIKTTIASYFDGLGENLSTVMNLPVHCIHLDLVSDPEQLVPALDQLPSSTCLSLGLVDGRNVWATDLSRATQTARKVAERIGIDRVSISSSCSLLHSPIDLDEENRLDPAVKPWLAFAKQKLDEIVLITKGLNDGVTTIASALAERDEVLESRRLSERVNTPSVRKKLNGLTTSMFSRQSPYQERSGRQQTHLGLPLFPTTTIGSFPQTAEVRRARSQHRQGRLSDAEYDSFLEQQTNDCIRWQEEAGLDVLVHGEFERNDMVEYFGERLNGYVSTENGWVQSYGTRCVKPPILYGDVSRKGPMTVKWTEFAQRQTDKPVKGMLTGPVTILAWSFVRDDQPLRETCRQIALAIREEVAELEDAGIQLIQIDEPALREGLPLKKSKWNEYLTWAVESFRLASSGVADTTQIHTHMCYCEFQDILQSISDLDADVISIETSRSQMELLDAFAEFRYPNAIGPGVYDIHSPRVPSPDEMSRLIDKAIEVIPRERIWINPDCGLKTRNWDEVRKALGAMVTAARTARQKHAEVSAP